jgi:hypothetical protein
MYQHFLGIDFIFRLKEVFSKKETLTPESRWEDDDFPCLAQRQNFLGAE